MNHSKIFRAHLLPADDKLLLEPTEGLPLPLPGSSADPRRGASDAVARLSGVLSLDCCALSEGLCCPCMCQLRPCACSNPFEHQHSSSFCWERIRDLDRTDMKDPVILTIPTAHRHCDNIFLAGLGVYPSYSLLFNCSCR